MVNNLIVRMSGKIELLLCILPKVFATDHHMLIFSQMTEITENMKDFLKMMGWKYLWLDGSTKPEDRTEHDVLFNANAKDCEYKAFILFTHIGGLGLNLQTADTVIMRVSRPI